MLSLLPVIHNVIVGEFFSFGDARSFFKEEEMKVRWLFFAVGAILMMSFPAGAATLTTADGVLSIKTPSEEWTEKSNSDAWFALTDGKNIIEMEHLSNGEELPAVMLPTGSEKLLYQAFIASGNEVFVMKAQVSSQEKLSEVISMLGTVQILKYNTKTAVSPKTSGQSVTQASSDSGYEVRPINAPYTVTADKLNIRSHYATDASIVGTVAKGDQLLVTGAVKKDGSDYGWYQVSYYGELRYAVSSYLEANASPSAASSEEALLADDDENKTPSGEGFPVIDRDGNYVGILVPYSNGVYYTEGEMAPYYDDGTGSYYGGIGEGRTVYQAVQCDYCGEWLPEGPTIYRDHVLLEHPEEYFGDYTSDQEGDLIICQWCGEYFEAVDEYRNHVLEEHLEEDDDEYEDDEDDYEDEDVEDDDQEMIRCEYCHLYFMAGEEYEEHLASHMDGSWEEGNLVQCEYCGEWFQAGAEYRSHVSSTHME